MRSLPMQVFTAATEGAGAPQNDAPITLITIQGIEFEVPQPYTEGHVVTAGEASALNQTLAENLRNNFAPKVKAAAAEYRKTNNLAEDAEVAPSNLDSDALQADLDKYAETYEFGVRTAGGTRTPMDPVGREAHRIATERVVAALKKNNIKLNSVSKEKMSELVTSTVAKYPDITAEAKRRVEAASSFALEDIGLGGPQPAAA